MNAVSHTVSKCCNLPFWLLWYIVSISILLPFSWKTNDASGSVHFTLPKLWTCIFRGAAQVGRKEPCSICMGLCSFTEADLRLHFWRMNLWEIDHFILKISLKICDVCWLQAAVVWIFFFSWDTTDQCSTYRKWQLAKENNVSSNEKNFQLSLSDTMLKNARISISLCVTPRLSKLLFCLFISLLKNSV